ncbi:nonribosomal peptide synthase [Aspergillus brasiliensis]|uniref:Nonribosomal peptide synthase n=1 Tax=Aspergillus brasiliensis TaxID=319629 RepID=A0A9W6DI03_9EURO|nr:nonribosomal peptide synthase [Aspergillus brasiliensis]GKZ47221.1 nonribosomal peptide synthase [Aspergillus brasiliensis]
MAEVEQRQLAYWLEQLEGSQPAELLCDKPRSTISGKAQVHHFALDDQLYQELQAFCQTHQTTPFVVLFAAFRATHYRLTGVDDATIGTPIPSNTNLLCLRTTVELEDSFHALVQRIHQTNSTALCNQGVPFQKIVSELRPRNPLVRTTFAVHSSEDANSPRLDGVTVATSKFDIEFHLIQEEAQRMSGHIIFSDDRFEASSMRFVASVFTEVLARGLKTPEALVSTLPLTQGLSALAEMGLTDIVRTDYPRDSSVVELFRRQVSLSPNAVAVKNAYSSSQLTYAELDRQSDQLAHWLVQRGLAPETMVAVLAPRSWETIVALLAILKANLAYVPLDVNIPGGRLESILSGVQGDKLVLLGAGVTPPTLQLQDVSFRHIAQVLEDEQGQRFTGTLPTPTATSLAYVIFTSGSTGKPKGVQVEHRGIVRLVRETNVASKTQSSGIIAHVANLAFDIATWEIYAALLNGGRVVCIDYMTVVDPVTLGRVLHREAVQSCMLTPAFLKQCLVSAPSALSDLELLIVAGDRLDPRDAAQAKGIIKGDLVNAYGPTENTTFSTIYKVPAHEKCVNGMPIGVAISNSGAFIMDPEQRLVPPGVMGELIVTGDGLARGYTDAELNKDRFVHVAINGESVRAYRTGDRVRHRPSDGMIEFFGRMDFQVKIRGHRIELPEIEHALLRSEFVSDAVTLAYQPEGEPAELVSFVTVQGDIADAAAQQDSQDQKDAAGDDSRLENQVESWRDLFETGTYADINTIDTTQVGRDFMGWKSMYDGELIDTAEMNEWLDDTIHHMKRNGGQPRNVLELGTGTGMILFNLIDSLSSYVGLDPSASAAAFVNKMAQARPALADKVDVRVGTAIDVDSLGALNNPDLVVINSVAQYFPTQEYLSSVVDKLLAIDGVERIYFGDVRSWALYRDFCTTRALHQLGSSATKEAVRRELAKKAAEEEEFLADPAYFTNLMSRLPGIVEHVEILPKRMKATNELSCYRFAAVIHKRQAGQPKTIQEISEDAWVDFKAKRLDRAGLLGLLQASSAASTIAVSNVPYSKTILERHIVDSLDDEIEEGADWLSSQREAAERCPALSALDLAELAEQAGFKVELSWARQYSLRGGLDAVFHRVEGLRPLFRFPTEHEGRSTESLTNSPLRRQEAQVVEARLKTALQALLPKYMIPARIAVLDKMPINANGKVDRKQLAKLASVFAKATKSLRQIVEPRTDLERAVCEELSSVLNVDAVGITDNFFDLGGHSLMAPRVAARINQRLNANILLRDVFAHPVVADLAKKVGESLGDSCQDKLDQDAGEDEDEAIEIEDEEELLTMSLATKLRHFNHVARPQCVKSLGIANEDIEEVLPATGVQTRMLVFIEEAKEMNITKPCIEHFVYRVPDELDPVRLEQAIVDVTKRYDAFRTVWVQVEHPLSPYAQCILNPAHPRAQLPMVHSVVHEYDPSPDSLWEQTIGNAQRSAEEYIRLDRPGAVVQVVHSADNKHHVLIFSLFHLIYDGMSFDFLRRSFAQAYEGVPPSNLPAVGMRHPVEKHYKTDWLATSMYWMKRLAGVAPFKAGQTVLLKGAAAVPGQFTSISTTQDTACEILESSMSLNELFAFSRIAKFPSPMAILQGAWAMTLAQTLIKTNKSAGQEGEPSAATNLDVQFGSVFHGRHSPEALRCVALMLDVFPTRIVFSDVYNKGEEEKGGGPKKRTHREICQELFTQYVDSLEYSEMPCPTIDFAKLTRRFDNTIILQAYPKEEDEAVDVDASGLPKITGMETLPGFTREENLQAPWKETNHGYPILMELWPGRNSEDEKFRLRCTYNNRWPGYEFMTQEWAQGLLLTLDQALEQILHNPDGEFDPVRLVEGRL